MGQWPTPEEEPGGIVCRPLFIPEGEEYEAIVRGALVQLMMKYNYVEKGAQSVETVVEAFTDSLSRTLAAWLPCYQAYAIKVISTMPENLIGYWPLWDSAGSARAADITVFHADGIASGVTFGSSGAGDGNTAAYFDSVDEIELAVATLSSRINMDEGTLLVWLRRDNWSEALGRWYLQIYADSNNLMRLRHDEAGRIIMDRTAQGSAQSFLYAVPGGTDWLCVVHTWSVENSLMKLYFDGEYVAQKSATLNSFSGAPAEVTLGTGLRAWLGKIAHVAIWDTILSDADISYVSAL